MSKIAFLGVNIVSQHCVNYSHQLNTTNHLYQVDEIFHSSRDCCYIAEAPIMHLVNFLMLVIVQHDIGCNSDAKNGLLHAMIVVQLTIICIFVCVCLPTTLDIMILPFLPRYLPLNTCFMILSFLHKMISSSLMTFKVL